MPAPAERRADRRAKPPRGKAAIGAFPSDVRPATGALTAVAGGTGDGVRRCPMRVDNLRTNRPALTFPVMTVFARMGRPPAETARGHGAPQGSAGSDDTRPRWREKPSRSKDCSI